MNTTVLSLIDAALQWSMTVFLVTGFWLKNSTVPPGKMMNTAWKICKWPAFVNIFTSPVLGILIDGGLSPIGVLSPFLDFACWWYLRNAGDDDWTKKLKAKVKEKVAAVGHKLVVVPA